MFIICEKEDRGIRLKSVPEAMKCKHYLHKVNVANVIGCKSVEKSESD